MNNIKAIKVLTATIYFLLTFVNLTDSKKNSVEASQDWVFLFYTSNRPFAGTDHPISIEIVGDLGSSGAIKLPTSKSQLEAGNVDRFSIKIDHNIGNVIELIITKEVIRKFFNFFKDWYLDKVIVDSPTNERYTFNCNCKITDERSVHRLKPSHTIKPPNDNESTTAFRVTGIVIIIVIFICLTILGFTLFVYKTRHICSNYLNTNHCFREEDEEVESRGEIDGRRRSNRNRNIRRIVVTTNDVVDYNTPLSVNKIDKPPSYQELFPLKKEDSVVVVQPVTTNPNEDYSDVETRRVSNANNNNV